jgi:hypothetical protein
MGGTIMVKFPQTITGSDGEWSDVVLMYRAAQYLKMTDAEFTVYIDELAAEGDREYARYLRTLSLPPYVARYIRDDNLKEIARYSKRRGVDLNFFAVKRRIKKL